METVFSYLIFLLQVETVTEISGNPFFEGKTLFPLADRDFLSSESCFLLFRAFFLEVKTVTQTTVETSSLYFL